MAHCDESIELISAALDGALSPEEQVRLEAHLAQCPACKALYEDLNLIHQNLLDLPPVEVPQGLTERIMDAVAAEAAQSKVVPLPQPRKSAFPWQRWAATAAAVAVVILGGWQMALGPHKGASDLKAASFREADLPSPPASVEPGLQTYSDGTTVPEVDASGFGNAEMADNSSSVQPRNEETAQASPEPTVEVVPARAKTTPSVPPTPTAAPAETPASSGAVAPRMAMNIVPSPIPADTSETGSGEETDIPSQEEPISPNIFVAQVLPSEEPPLLPEPTDETAVPNDALLTSIGNESISEDDEPEETLPMTEAELAAMAQVREYLDLSDDYTWDGTTANIWTTEAWETRLAYTGLRLDGQYYCFELYETPLFVEDPEGGTRFVNFYAVPVDGGDMIEGNEENHDLFMTHE